MASTGEWLAIRKPRGDRPGRSRPSGITPRSRPGGSSTSPRRLKPNWRLCRGSGRRSPDGSSKGGPIDLWAIWSGSRGSAGCFGRSDRRAQRPPWLLRSIRPTRASYRDLPPENGSSGHAWVSWPPAFGGRERDSKCACGSWSRPGAETTEDCDWFASWCPRCVLNDCAFERGTSS
jgi:hypothetical protein